MDPKIYYSEINPHIRKLIGASVTGFYGCYSSSQIRHFSSSQKLGHPVSKKKWAGLVTYRVMKLVRDQK